MNTTKHGSRQSAHRRPLSWILAALFALSMVMGTGPGVLLVNRPDALFGVPLIFAWGIFWYLVQVAIVLVAYFAIWKSAGDPDGRPSSETKKGSRP
jgi:membrane protein implicated in regulation of membrane protease activity